MDNFQAYGEFARVYDMFQDNVDYQTWGKWLKQQLAAQLRVKILDPAEGNILLNGIDDKRSDYWENHAHSC